MSACRSPPLWVSAVLLAAVALATGSGSAAARILQVGAGQAYASPSAAAAAAQDGDSVTIAPGTYYDCALWHANGLTITGGGPEVLITDTACAGKAAFVIQGDHVVVRGLNFARVRVADGNGAGIRAEGRDLTVEDSHFVNNQVGILAGGPGGSLRVIGSTFSANGTSLDGHPTHTVFAGGLDLLRIERSLFQDARGGDYIASAARRTELVGNRLATVGGGMTGPLVSVHGGALTLDGNTFGLDAGTTERPGAVLVTGGASVIEVRGNTLIEPIGSVPLLRNWTGLTATEAANAVPPNARVVSEDGASYHRLLAQAASMREQLHDVLGQARHQAGQLARELKLAW